jgi:hypothetical protein
LVQSESSDLRAPDQGSTGEPGGEEQRLRDAERAFDAGDYRELARRLEALRSASSPEVAARVKQLARAVVPDRLQLAVLAACSLILLATFIHYVLP